MEYQPHQAGRPDFYMPPPPPGTFGQGQQGAWPPHRHEDQNVVPETQQSHSFGQGGRRHDGTTNRDRSRSRRRHRRGQGSHSAPPLGQDTANSVINQFGKNAICEALPYLMQHFTPQSFADTVDNLPHFYKQELLRCPPHLRVDSAGMSKAEAINNNAELNRLRRERCLPLATPQTAKFYAQESFQVLMVSGVVKRRFWQLWRLVDLTTSSESIWKATCRFLTNNPHKPVVRPSTRKHADMDEDDLQSEADEPNGPPSSPIPKRATSGRMALEALSAPSPDAQASAQPGANLSTDQVQKWAAERIQADIRSMDVKDLMLTTGRKWPNTISIERAVEALPHADALGAVFKLSFAAYKKAFTKAFANLDLSKRGILAQLRAQIKELNLEMDRKSDPKQLSEVLAWAKASALLRAD
ncbi:unnamed protein product [Polarella glacialis]|uniref:Uncharacterized protein n=1 Tax=Polarella glacialis TaxID=89957 RepID=A0A813L7S2_POLGL|nr:unnamed protein product [Polarella glacialis]|mmetsp:Transcript_18227/g.32299  ORF Transcript_18227/g.32299 Transcript_18227/m.32299 type:complete len:413 (-) Transcript_18227:220-1458(-)